MSRVVAKSPWLPALAVGVGFFLLAEVSAPFVFPPYQNAVVWLPGGLALGALVRARRAHWPHFLTAIFVAEVASVLVHGDALVVTILWGLANCLRALIAAELLRRFVGLPMRLDRLRDVSGLVAFGGLIGPGISATLGTIAVAYFYPSDHLGQVWLFWFLSDAVGTVLVAPLILTVKLERRTFDPARILEWGLLTLILLIVGNALFGGEPSGILASMPFVSFPLLIYAAFRTGPVGAAFASVILGTIAVGRTTEGRGPFGDPDLEPYSRVLTVELFIAMLSLTALTLAAAVRERQHLVGKERFLAQVGSALAESLDVTTTLPGVTRRIVSSVAQGAAIWLVPPQGGLELVAQEGLSEPMLHRLEEQAGYVSRDIPSWVDPHSHYVLLPLRGHEGLLGVMAVLPREPDRVPAKAELELLEELARTCALAVENAGLYVESQRAIEMRDEFIAIAAHELRTPLTAMKLQLQSLLRRKGGELSGAVTETLLRQVGRLTRLVENLLDISRLSRGHIELSREPTNLSELARDLVLRLNDEAAREGTELVLRTEEEVRGLWDPLRLEQVLTNLLTNALKFGRGRQVEIVVDQVGDEAHVTVTDHGRGIPQNELRRIFNRFAQAVPAREFGGLGLGLYLAKEMVEAHGGRIWVTSVPGEGATFGVALPAIPRVPSWRPPTPLIPQPPA